MESPIKAVRREIFHSEKMSDEESTSCNKQKTFANLPKGAPILLSKSHLSSIKERKSAANDKFMSEYEKRSGIKLTKEQLSKKINNMRNTVKGNAHPPENVPESICTPILCHVN